MSSNKAAMEIPVERPWIGRLVGVIGALLIGSHLGLRTARGNADAASVASIKASGRLVNERKEIIADQTQCADPVRPYQLHGARDRAGRLVRAWGAAEWVSLASSTGRLVRYTSLYRCGFERSCRHRD